MSRGRKIFRFLKWIEDIKGLYYYIIYKPTSIRNLWKALMSLSALFYHFFDNLVWANNVGVMGEYFVGDIKLKNTKNTFSLLRNIIKIILDIYKFQSLHYINKQNEEEVFEAFDYRVENFQPDIHIQILNATIEIRAKLRFKLLDIVHSFLRIVTLVFSLRIEPFYSNVHPMFSNFCGMLQSIITLFKALINPDADKILPLRRSMSQGKMAIPNKKRSNNLQMAILEADARIPSNILLEENYFQNYYIDFNKDYPVLPQNVIKIK